MESSEKKKIHIALSATNLKAVVQDYSERLDSQPEVLVENEYALWRTESLNLSVRVDGSVPEGTLRHLGFEDSTATDFSETVDPMGIIWERFSAELQRKEIEELWP